MRTWLVIDCNYLCYRAFYAMGNLSHSDVGTGVLFGFFRDIKSLQALHDTDRIVFCFDYGKSLRCNDYPGYKAKRKELPEEKLQALLELKRQAKILRTHYLQELGFRNVFYQKGYEADDIIASICTHLPRNDEAIIISSDHDLYQLLSPRVLIFNPAKNKAVTEHSFSKEYGVSPSQWVDVKAMAGCTSDDIIGIKGIGEITAAKFLSGKLKPGSAAFQRIVHGNKVWKKNRHLVRLPYPGTDTFDLVKDRTTDERWDRVAESLGMNSLSTTRKKKGTRNGFGLKPSKEEKETKQVSKRRKL